MHDDLQNIPRFTIILLVCYQAVGIRCQTALNLGVFGLFVHTLLACHANKSHTIHVRIFADFTFLGLCRNNSLLIEQFYKHC